MPAMIRITITSVLVDDQAKALAFYTGMLGFAPALDIPLGPARWLTVVSPADPEGVQLLLEPNDHPAAKAFQQALKADGIPLTTFTVEDVRADYERLSGLGVRFAAEPAQRGQVISATLDDTCGNLIGLHQVLA
jgi:catechol 2,3-dioxygenase-like lactoylglutathione lyase family enzyme